MTGGTQKPVGMSSTELASSLAQLRETASGMDVRDIARIEGSDDLLLFLEDGEERAALHLVPGGARGRVCLTRRRYRRQQMQTGPLIDRLRTTLKGASVTGFEQSQGEKRCRITFARTTHDTKLNIEIELFGPRGLWCVCDTDGQILFLSRLPRSRSRELRPGTIYEPPAGKPPGHDSKNRFSDSSLEEIDRHFTERDLAQESNSLRESLTRALASAEKKIGHRISGLEQKEMSINTAPELRQQADMLLAYGHTVDRGATELRTPHPEDPQQELIIPLDPAKAIPVQARNLYQRARKLETSIDSCREQIAIARESSDRLQSLNEALRASQDQDSLEEVREKMIASRWLKAPGEQAEKPSARTRKITQGEGFRQFQSAEGYAILVGRNNQQNDKLSLRIARGNDLWFHVGRGMAGSHVVVRLPKGKTASLETMLDAGTLAVYFSKGRDSTTAEALYTHAKNLRKPKGSLPGRVTVTGEKSLGIRMEPERIRRLLNSAGDEISG